LHYNSANEDVRSKIESDIKAVAKDSDIKVAFVQADIGSYDSVRHLHKSAVEQVGNVDVLFNNAGTNAGYNTVQNLRDVPIDAFEQSWRVNTGSGILLAQLCLPHMESQGWGRIIFDSSVAAFTGGVVGPHYASSKSAQHGFVHWLAKNVAKKGITVNAVAPALIGGTNMMDSQQGDEVQKRIASSMLCTISESGLISLIAKCRYTCGTTR
jgi:3-oxoacyl-[acyl-carrier protein] reductase